MKSKDLLIKRSGLYMVLIISAASLFASCHKDNGTSPKSSPPPLIGFQSKQLSTIGQIDTADLLGTSADSFNLEITLSAPSNMPSPISATIVPDTGALNVYNAYQQDKAFTPPQGWSGRNCIPFEQLPASDYSLQNGGKVTINPGQQSVMIRVSFAGDKINFYNNNAFENALSLKLVGANGATLANGLSEALILIRAQSAYEGIYQTTGTEVWAGVSQNYSMTQNLTSVTPNTILKTSFGSYGADTYITINPDNSVSINFLAGVPGPFYFDGLSDALDYFSVNPQITFSQTGVNKYDPATKTLTLNYQQYYNGTSGNISETLTLKQALSETGSFL